MSLLVVGSVDDLQEGPRLCKDLTSISFSVFLPAAEHSALRNTSLITDHGSEEIL